MFCPFAANSSCVAASRTWPMLPGADWNCSEKTVWIESTMMKRRLEARDLLEDALETGLGEEVERRALDAEPLAARLDLVLGFFARAVEHRPERLARSAPPPAAAASTCRCPARRRSARATRARRRRRARDRTRRCPVVSRSATTVSMSAYSCGPAVDGEAVPLRDVGRRGDRLRRCAAPRRASSTRRTRGSGRATSATARRIPGRRRRSWFSLALSYQLQLSAGSQFAAVQRWRFDRFETSAEAEATTSVESDSMQPSRTSISRSASLGPNLVLVRFVTHTPAQSVLRRGRAARTGSCRSAAAISRTSIDLIVLLRRG